MDYDYKVGDKILIRKDGILCKTESRYDSEPWTITSVHTNGTIRVERRSKSERINIRRVILYFDTEENKNLSYMSPLTLNTYACC